jgi:hypothetical protein
LFRADRQSGSAAPVLAQLDRNVDDVFLRLIANVGADSHRAALALTQQQHDFVDKRNASFGRRAHDLRQARRSGWRNTT